MIYFIQDTSTHEIKIGFTGGAVADRVKSLQTGNPAGLVLLAGIEGGESEERDLHRRFASSHVRGEWFRPSEEVLIHILTATGLNAYEKGKTDCKFRGGDRPVKQTLGGAVNTYLAGKVSRYDWRHTLVPSKELTPGISVVNDDEEWPVKATPFWGRFYYCGPYFISGRHTTSHGDDSHGYEECEYTGEERDDNWERGVYGQCMRAIDRADLVFAWIDRIDCYGTIAEIGYARALGKHIWIASPRRLRDFWFVYRMADRTCFTSERAGDALRELDSMAEEVEVEVEGVPVCHGGESY